MGQLPEEFEGILTDEFNRLRGRILGLIESWGLDERQENGAKNTFKSLSYDAQARIVEVIEDHWEE
jgi:hypothetical protein